MASPSIEINPGTSVESLVLRRANIVQAAAEIVVNTADFQQPGPNVVA